MRPSFTLRMTNPAQRAIRMKESVESGPVFPFNTGARREGHRLSAGQVQSGLVIVDGDGRKSPTTAQGSEDNGEGQGRM